MGLLDTFVKHWSQKYMTCWHLRLHWLFNTLISYTKINAKDPKEISSSYNNLFILCLFLMLVYDSSNESFEKPLKSVISLFSFKRDPKLSQGLKKGYCILIFSYKTHLEVLMWLRIHYPRDHASTLCFHVLFSLIAP